MLISWGAQQTYCDGISRRNFLRAGGLGLGGLTLTELLRSDAQAGPSHRPKSVIYIVLPGGPSHIDMYDLKPEAPAEYRGPFHPIATRLPGIDICELMPRQAQLMDQLVLLRGIRSVENDHFLSEVYSGLPRTAGARPAFGSVVSRLAAPHSPMPPYISLNEQTVDQFEFEKPHYLGTGYAPFRPFEESLADMTPSLPANRLDDRRSLLAAFDAFRRETERNDAFRGIDQFQAKALEIVGSSAVQAAFDLSKEPPETLKRYGDKAGKYPHQTVKSILYDWDAKPFIRARRLVESGARVVTLRVGSWDHHSGPEADVFFALKGLMPTLDQSFSALVEDLKDRGLDQDVLVVMLGEFGRTPKISYPGPGREHWADAGCAVLFGGGLKMGQMLGATDTRAELSLTGTTTFENIIATIYHVLGIDLDIKLPNFSGRPQHLLDDRRPIRELIE